MLYTAIFPSPVGNLLLAEQDGALVGLWLEGQKYFGEGLPSEPPEQKPTPVLDAAHGWLDRYFSGQKPSPSELPLRPAGSAFRRALWMELCEIPYGQMTTYGELAKKVAARMNRPNMPGQAVGGAIGHNPILIVIPCHRVISASRSLTGYAGGLSVKRALLQLGGIDTSKLA